MVRFTISCIFLVSLLAPANSSIQICGSSLTKAMQMLCPPKYYSANKRSTEGENRPLNLPAVSSSWSENHKIPTFYDSFPFALDTLTHSASSYGDFEDLVDMPVRRQEQNDFYIKIGIVDDCCKQACSMRTLLSYCSTY